jgi:hypothetical protein
MENTGVQQLFFQHIKNSLLPHLSLVDSVAEVLNISNDSAYRRIRGEKSITFEEIERLSAHFKISMDQFLHLKSNSFIFSGSLPELSNQYYGEWLKNVLRIYTYVNTFEKKHLYFLSKDFPFTSYFQIPELSTFKSFVWMRTFLHYDDLKSKKFSLKDRYPEFEELGMKINQVFNQIPTTELWNLVCINATLQQIEFYRETNVFESDDDVLLLYDKLEELVTHFEKQAEAGKKFMIGETPGPHSADYNMFLNELFLGDNTVVAELGSAKVSFLNYAVLYIVESRDEKFCDFVYKEVMNLIRRSTQISVVGEKGRAFFFNRLRENIHSCRRAVSSRTFSIPHGAMSQQERRGTT